MKIRSAVKFAIAPLLCLFLATSMGNAIAMTWCFGSDGHVEVEKAWVSGCVDEFYAEKLPNQLVENFTQQLVNEAHCGSCLDLRVGEKTLAFGKRLNKVPRVSFGATLPILSPSNQDLLPLHRLVALRSTRISSSLIAHRTVVLRN